MSLFDRQANRRPSDEPFKQKSRKNSTVCTNQNVNGSLAVHMPTCWKVVICQADLTIRVDVWPRAHDRPTNGHSTCHRKVYAHGIKMPNMPMASTGNNVITMVAHDCPPRGYADAAAAPAPDQSLFSGERVWHKSLYATVRQRWPRCFIPRFSSSSCWWYRASFCG